ncbi:hypothetical protein YC2023_030377 [Brassica napus]|uniref:(rape) hypothetical protein n=1 Tax=Brassica napus TaxID=3708 RepID=A0A816VQ45_BRANA|nr:unnamed protein product [Brassica napus]
MAVWRRRGERRKEDESSGDPPAKATPAKSNGAADTESKARQYDDERSEFGGFGCATGKVRSLLSFRQINHEEEVNRARYIPQNPFVIATKTVNAEVKFKAGYLLSGSDDAQICLWDIDATPKNKVIDAQQIFKAHEGVVEDVAWHMSHEHLFGSVGDDQYLLVWDLRSPSASKPIQSLVAHSMEPYIPFNINPAGMQPVLTTTYLLAFSSILASIVGSPFLLHVKEILNPESTVRAPPWVYYSVYAFCVSLQHL